MKPFDTLIDFITGREVPDIGSEANRQAFERILVLQKGFLKEDIEVDVPLNLVVAGEPYNSRLDLAVSIGGRRMMAIKCAAGSLGSREREILAAARLLESFQIPVSVVTDGRESVVLDTVSGEKIGDGVEAVPTKEVLSRLLSETVFTPLPDERLEREKLIFRSYDMENVNIQRNPSGHVSA